LPSVQVYQRSAGHGGEVLGRGKGKGKGGQTCKSAWENFTLGGGQTKGENPGGGGAFKVAVTVK